MFQELCDGFPVFYGGTGLKASLSPWVMGGGIFGVCLGLVWAVSCSLSAALGAAVLCFQRVPVPGFPSFKFLTSLLFFIFFPGAPTGSILGEILKQLQKNASCLYRTAAVGGFGGDSRYLVNLATLKLTLKSKINSL